jgi:hypothetical protein
MPVGVWRAIQLDASKNPKHGKIIAEAEGNGAHCPAHIMALWKAGEIAIGWTYNKPLRQLPTGSLARVRRARLKRRLAQKAPLLADELFARELNARPAFFAGSRD